MLQLDCLVMWNQGGGWRQALLFAIPNGELRHPAVALQLSGITAKQRELLSDDEYLTPFGQGVVPGAPDLVMLADGGCPTLIEIKVPPDKLRELKGGSQSRGQKLFMKRARELGYDYRIIDSQTAFWDLAAEKRVTLRVARPWALSQPSALVRKTAPAAVALPVTTGR